MQQTFEEARQMSTDDRPPSLWTKALEWLKNNAPEYAYNNWFVRIEQVDAGGGRLLLRIATLFHRDWIIEHYGDLIRKAVDKVAGEGIAIEWIVSGTAEPEAVGDATPPSGVQLGEVEIDAAGRPRARLREHYTFENFVVGPSNQLAHGAALAVADHPGKKYNPLFIYGGTGLGKTHLLHAIGNRIRARDPAVRIVYIPTEAFLNEFLERLRKGRMDEFRRRFREEVDVLMMDDVQLLRKKEETQNEFFHTFNELLDAGKAIVLTSDIKPADLPIEERLRSRFSSGLTADVYDPPFEVRLAILKRKAELERLNLPDPVALLVAEKFVTNVRELEGALTRLAAHASLTQRALTVQYAEEILRDLLPPKPALGVDHIQATVARFYGLAVTDLIGDKRTRPIAHARAVSMYFCRKLIENESFPAIGEAFGNKHHTTVMSAVERIADRRAVDPRFDRELGELERQITGT